CQPRHTVRYEDTPVDPETGEGIRRTGDEIRAIRRLINQPLSYQSHINPPGGSIVPTGALAAIGREPAVGMVVPVLFRRRGAPEVLQRMGDDSLVGRGG